MTWHRAINFRRLKKSTISSEQIDHIVARTEGVDHLGSTAPALGGYSLASALLIVRRTETQASRSAVFAEIKAKNRAYSLVEKAYCSVGSRFLQPALLFLYMLKCVSSVGPGTKPRSKIVSIANFENERHSIKRVLALNSHPSSTSLQLKRRHIIGKGQLKALLRQFAALPRSWRFIAHIARSQEFMPACRVTSTLAYYIRFDSLFRDNPSMAAGLIASNYSPEALGLAAAAHRNGRHVIYVNHAQVPANSKFVPPVLADCSIFFGEAIHETYTMRSRCTSNVIFIGQPGEARQMVWREEVRTIGIFLTALTKRDTIDQLVRAIKCDRPDIRILIRHHPVSLLETDLSDLTARHRDICISKNSSLTSDISKCDVVFCGNSGVATNVLRGGRPIAYLANLDELPHDYLGLAESGLVCEVDGWRSDLYSYLKEFYANDDWTAIMCKYDASYGYTEDRILQQAQAQLEEWINLLPLTDQAAFHA